MKTFDTRSFDLLLTNLDKVKDDLHKLQADTLPVKAGNLAVRHFKENFRLGGYQNGDLKPWKTTRRQLSGGQDAASQYGPLLSRQARLMGATRFEPGANQVTIINDTPYARIHNEGGDISQNITITAKMRKFAWAKFFEAGGKKKEKGKEEPEQPEAAKIWRALALTKKTSISRTIHIPRRQFMGKAIEVVL
jgi:phage gpG-like protein